MALEIKFIIRYNGGSAENNYLDLYDAASSMQGLAKALSITSHALLNEGQVKYKGDSTKNVDFLLHPSKKGSFIEVITIVFDNPAFQAIGASVLAAAFWDFIKYTWRVASGRKGTLSEYRTKKLLENNDLFDQEISKSLEIPLQQLHRPILNDKNIQIEIKRPKSGTVLKFDKDTLDYVMSQEDPVSKDNIKGNVTKYNILSGIGRFYDDELEKTIAFHSVNLNEDQKKILSWSLHNSNGNNSGGKILLDLDMIKSYSGYIKRYLIRDARQQNDSQNLPNFRP